MKKAISLYCCLFLVVVAAAQGLPPIFGTTPQAILPAKVLVAYPKNTWLENLVIGHDGNLYVTNYPAGKIYKVSPTGQQEIYTTIPGKIAGIETLRKDEYLVIGWDQQGKAAIFGIDAKRNSHKLLNIAGGMFPNGILHLSGNKYLISDSYAGCLWLYDADGNTTTPWLKSPLLERDPKNQEMPAANGIKIFKNTLYISNTNRHTLIKVPVVGLKPGQPELYLDKVNIDDFSFDGAGNMYAATNVYNYVIKITPAKKVSIVAGLNEGAAGCTATAIARNKQGQNILYVTTSGGMAVPPPSGVQEGKIIQLSLR